MTWKKRTPAANRRRRRRYERDRAWVLHMVSTKGLELASRVINMIGYLGLGPPSQRPPKERASVLRRRRRRELYDDREWTKRSQQQFDPDSWDGPTPTREPSAEL